MTGQARASATDPGARVMKMADGGFRPAFNGQFATDTAAQVIVGVDVSNAGSDLGQLAPMVEQARTRYGRAPAEVPADKRPPAPRCRTRSSRGPGPGIWRHWAG